MFSDNYYGGAKAPSAPGPETFPTKPDYPVPQINLHAPPYSAERAAHQRELYVTKKHTIPEKMELYNASTKGKLDDLKELLIEKGYSITEEVSKEGHFWTVLHYATHYGHVQTLEFLLDHISQFEHFFDILNLQTIEGKTPLFCSTLSGDIKIETKKQIIKLLFDTYNIDLSLRKASGEDLIDLARKNNLYDFIALYCLRED